LRAIVNCSQVITLTGPARPRTGLELRELGIIENGAVLVEDGRIAAVGPRGEMEKRIPPGCEVIDAGDRILLPGFVDAHTHPVFAGNRADEFARRAEGTTYQEIAASGGGIRSTVRKTRAASSEDLYAAALRYSEWFLRTGTTTIEAKSGYGLSLESELKMLRVIQRLGETSGLTCVPTFLGAHEVPDEYRGDREGYVSLITNEMLPLVVGEKLATYCDVFCEPAVFTTEESRRILGRARSLGLGLRMHADQLGLSHGAELAADLRSTTADHLEYTGASGIEAMRDAGVQPVLLPGSVYALGSRHYPAARAMVEAGLAIVLATDFNPGSSPTPSMTMILSLASTHLKLSPAEAISAATVNAAYSLGQGREVGSIETGKRADLVIHDCADYRELACFFGIEHPWMVLASGSVVFSRKSLH
jgi:imidazolonepropionase